MMIINAKKIIFHQNATKYAVVYNHTPMLHQKFYYGIRSFELSFK